jgi:hypothetical protein
VDLAGGLPQTLADAPNPLGGSWNSDDTIIFVATDELLRISAAGGTPTLLRNSGNPDKDRAPSARRRSTAPGQTV